MRRDFNYSILLLITLIVQIGCNSVSNNSALQNKPSSLVDNKNKDYEDFNTFIKRFKADSIFQHSRIYFPLIKEFIGDNEDAKNTIIRIDSMNWQYLTLKYDPSYATRKIDAYTEKFIISKDSVRLLYEGVDNGINVEFVFELKNNKWYLIRWNDLSD